MLHEILLKTQERKGEGRREGGKQEQNKTENQKGKKGRPGAGSGSVDTSILGAIGSSSELQEPHLKTSQV